MGSFSGDDSVLLPFVGKAFMDPIGIIVADGWVGTLPARFAMSVSSSSSQQGSLSSDSFRARGGVVFRNLAVAFGVAGCCSIPFPSAFRLIVSSSSSQFSKLPELHLFFEFGGV